MEINRSALLLMGQSSRVMSPLAKQNKHVLSTCDACLSLIQWNIKRLFIACLVPDSVPRFLEGRKWKEIPSLLELAVWSGERPTISNNHTT